VCSTVLGGGVLMGMPLGWWSPLSRVPWWRQIVGWGSKWRTATEEAPLALRGLSLWRWGLWGRRPLVGGVRLGARQRPGECSHAICQRIHHSARTCAGCRVFLSRG